MLYDPLHVGLYTAIQAVNAVAFLCQKVGVAPELSISYAWTILTCLTKVDRATLLSMPFFLITATHLAEIAVWLKRLAHHEPLQYIVGSVPFLTCTIHIKAPILIPRPETEEWVDYLLKRYQEMIEPGEYILDMCTGSGCIGLAVAATLPHARVIGSDIDPRAVALAEENKQSNQIAHISFVQSDLFAQLPVAVRYAMVIANPPYLSYDEWLVSEPSVKEWENPKALIAEDAGFALLAQIIIQAPHWFHTRSTIPGILALEMSPSHIARAYRYMGETGYKNREIYTDASGRERAIIAEWHLR